MIEFANSQCVMIAHIAERSQSSKKVKLVNAFLPSAQSVELAFAIIKTERREDLGIIKTMGICSIKILTKSKRFFTIKHIGKIIKEQIFTGLLIIFTIL